MPIFTTKYRFTGVNIDAYAPEKSGVYGLYDPIETVIYFGKSETSIKARLYSHHDGSEGGCTKKASFFNTEVCANTSAREKDLLEEYKRLHDKLPKCNEVI